MAYSRRELILQAVESLLAAPQSGEVEAPTVGRSYASAAEASRLPRQDILLMAPPERLGEVVDNEWASGDQVQRVFTFGVVSRFRGANDGPPIDQVGDAFSNRTVIALSEDTTVGGLALDVRELGTRWDQEQEHQLFGETVQFFEVRYETRRTDPTAAPD